MKSKRRFNIYILALMFLGAIYLFTQTMSCSAGKQVVSETIDTLQTNQKEIGIPIALVFKKGPEYNHPLMAVWIENMDGAYLQTIYVAQSIAKGVYAHGDKSSGKWLEGPVRRPAALPVWSHKRGIKEDDGLYIPTQNTAMPDAVTGATPQADFIIQSVLSKDTPSSFKVLFEINQTWDWNEFWTNNKFPDDENYKNSCQPSLIYGTTIKPSDSQKEYPLELIGHGHPSGADGSINEDLSTMTTALEISREIIVLVSN